MTLKEHSTNYMCTSTETPAAVAGVAAVEFLLYSKGCNILHI